MFFGYFNPKIHQLNMIPAEWQHLQLQNSRHNCMKKKKTFDCYSCLTPEGNS